MTAVTYGLDFYSGNGHVDLAKAKTEDGIAFFVRKVSEGITYVDPGWASDYDAGARLGLLPGVYHFARPRTSNASAEAAFFLSKVGTKPRGGIVALDLEDQAAASALGLPAMAGFADLFLTIVGNAFGCRPWLYTYQRWLNDPAFATVKTKWPLWVPAVPSAPGEVVQAVHAVGTLGVLDVDTYLGTIDQLRVASGIEAGPMPAPSPPPPVPAPTPPNPGDTMDSGILVKSSDTADKRLFVWTAAYGLRHLTAAELGVVDRTGSPHVGNPGNPEVWAAGDIAAMLADR